MKIGVSGQELGKQYSLDKTLQILKSFNVRHMEVWPCNIPDANSRANGYSYSNKDIEEAKSIFRSYEIEPCALSFPAAFVKEVVDDTDIYLHELCLSVEAAYKLGAKFVNTYCYHLSLNQLNEDKLRKATREAIILAEKLGVTLLVENEAHDVTKNPKGMLNVIDVFGGTVKTNFDPTNYYHASVEPYPYAYKYLADKIGYVHIKNACIYNKKTGCQEKYKGSSMTGLYQGMEICYTKVEEGAVNIESILKNLKKDLYDGFVVIEPHCNADDVPEFLKSDVKYLKDFEMRNEP